MSPAKMPDNFYDRIKPRLYQRVGRELRLAYRVLDLGCGACELAQYLSETYGQKVTGVDISSNSFPNNRNITRNNKRIRCIRKDAARLTFIRNETIDAAIIFWALHEMKNSRRFCKRHIAFCDRAAKYLLLNSLATRWPKSYGTRVTIPSKN